ncbi:MAG TPA: hypothetical protein VNP95_03090 [Thermomicrobiales bacterium]|nr:hypothetical protein [Thermomicrobiales bacterium]
MPSGSTRNPPPGSSERQHLRLTRRRFGIVLVSGGVLAGLSACAEGTARDAERGKQADAKRTSVVDEIQATQSARFLEGTPPASPTAEP